MQPICIMKFGGNTLANKQKLLMAADLIKSRYTAGFIPVVVASANGNLTDVLLDHAFSITPTPDKRELDMLITTGERVSVALLSDKVLEAKADNTRFGPHSTNKRTPES